MKKEIAYYMRRLYRQKLTTTSGGNISFFEDPYIYITPSGTDKGRIQASDIAVTNINGDFLDYKKRSMETAMHLAIYNARPDVKAIVHAHPVHATSFACRKSIFPTNYTSEGRLILGEVGIAKYALMGTDDLAKSVAQTALKHNVILMENHGVIALGKNLLEAFDRLEVLEFTAQLIHFNQNGENVNLLNFQQVKDIDEFAARLNSE
ncbi:MAG: class II aldolase/adducin family protein [Bacteroidales bacterium]|nr:class II aldolase/adducin family protein [Bacteroidales bacterium]